MLRVVQVRKLGSAQIGSNCAAVEQVIAPELADRVECPEGWDGATQTDPLMEHMIRGSSSDPTPPVDRGRLGLPDPCYSQPPSRNPTSSMSGGAYQPLEPWRAPGLNAVSLFP